MSVTYVLMGPEPVVAQHKSDCPKSQSNASMDAKRNQ